MQQSIILSCSTLRQELEFVMKKIDCSYPIEWIDSGLHVWPDKLRMEIQKKIDEIDSKYTTVLLLFGFCGNSLVGIKACGKTLILPKTADCIPIFLGSNKMREKAGIDTYFFTQGYLNLETTMVTDYKRSIEKYGEKKGKRLVKAMMVHYKRLAVIDTGTFEVESVVEGIKDLSQTLNIPTVVLEGNLKLIENLLTRKWDDENFLLVKPGETITLEDSLEVGRSMIC